MIATTGCWTRAEHEVVVYVALDREFSEPILDDFQQHTNIVVRHRFDSESSKTVGLANAIIAERNRPQCDLFWNNEILHSLRLEKLGLLEVHRPPTAEGFPADFRGSDGRWHGFAARARVLIVNTEKLRDVPKDQWPDSILDLTDPRWKGRAGIAKPLFGTTATHAAVLFAHWGDERAEKFFREVNKNAKILAGNKQVAQDVAAGRLVFGLTDTDDAVIERDRGESVAIIFPDQGTDGLGTLFIPNTLCIIKNGPNTANARRLVDYLLRAEIESRLARGASAQFPLHSDAKSSSRVELPADFKRMPVNFPAAAERWERAAKFLRKEFVTGQ